MKAYRLKLKKKSRTKVARLKLKRKSRMKTFLQKKR